jgi:hypothetical protein
MGRRIGVAVALALLASCAGSTAWAGAVFLGPGPGLTGNDTGGIISYTPALNRTAYRVLAADWCARWGRLSHVTSMHRRYGDYVGFVCIDRPGMIH